MLSRRNMLTLTTSAAVAGMIHGTGWAADPASTDVQIDTRLLPPDVKAMMEVDWPLNAVSAEEWCAGMKRMQNRWRATPEATRLTEAFLRSKGFSTLDDTDMTREECFNLCMQDPAFAMRQRMSTTTQHIMWDRVMRLFHNDADKYLTLMERADKAGPGSLTLDPNLVIPDWARHEIHAQPGGFVGDPLAGWVYHFAVTKAFLTGGSEHDEVYIEVAKNLRKPKDDQVRRILDIGCGTGQSTQALKLRFPNAEVHGVDVGAPMVRYAHTLAAKRGLDIHFHQALAQKLPFKDGYFDLVSDQIMFHESLQTTHTDILKEVHRVIRPGGVFAHSDIGTQGQPNATPSKTILSKASTWSNIRFNVEPHWGDYIDSDFPQHIRDAGFAVVETDQQPTLGRANVVGRKAA